MGMLLLNANDREETATRYLAEGLNAACAPWLGGAARDAIEAKLDRSGWDVSDAAFGSSGGWGDISVSLVGDSYRSRGCEVRVRTNEQPWSTIALTTAAQAWIAQTFPGGERVRSLSSIVSGQAARVAVWQDAGAKITMTVFLAKQAAPLADLILAVERS